MEPLDEAGVTNQNSVSIAVILVLSFCPRSSPNKKSQVIPISHRAPMLREAGRGGYRYREGGEFQCRLTGTF